MAQTKSEVLDELTEELASARITAWLVYSLQSRRRHGTPCRRCEEL